MLYESEREQIVKVVRGVNQVGERLPVTIFDRRQRRIKFQYLTADQERECGDVTIAHYTATFDGQQWWLKSKINDLDW